MYFIPYNASPNPASRKLLDRFSVPLIYETTVERDCFPSWRILLPRRSDRSYFTAGPTQRVARNEENIEDREHNGAKRI